MTTCIRNGKIYQTVPFDETKSKPGINGACVGCAAEFDGDLCMSLPDDCSTKQHPTISFIWKEIKNDETDPEAIVRQRSPDLEVA